MAKVWSPEEDELLVQWRNEGFSLREISIKLKRSYGGTKERARKLGTAVNRVWTEEDKAFLLELKSEGRTAAYIAKCLGRTKWAVESYLARLRSAEGWEN